MNLSLLLHFTKQELIDRYSGSVLGGAWAFVMPLVNILIFIFVFSEIMGARLESFGARFASHGYSIYLITGVIAWTAFANTVSRTTHIFKDKAGLIGKVNLSMAQLPLYILLTEAIVFTLSYLFFAIFLVVIDFPITRYALLVPLIFVVQQLLAYALGFTLATLSVFIKDIREFVAIALQLWFWLTPIVYVVDIIPDHLQFVFDLNPMFHILNAYRDLLLFGQAFELSSILTIALSGVVILGASLILFKKLERDIRDFV